MPRIATILVVLALLGGTTAAFAVTEALKLERSPVGGVRFDRVFSPTCDCPTDTATLRLKLREADRVTATVVDAKNEVVRTLSENEPTAKGPVELTWDGRTDSGAIAPDGRYRLRLHLGGQRRTILVPTTVQIDTVPPEVTVLRANPAEFSPDGDGHADRLTVVYRSSEHGSPILSVRGGDVAESVVVEGKARRAGRSHVSWGGKVAGEVLRPDQYVLALSVRDQAGNLSTPAEAGAAEIRFVELDEERYELVAGETLEFTVIADAETFAWEILRLRDGRAGEQVAAGTGVPGEPTAAELTSAIEPGRYLLRVTVADRRDNARVIVSKAGT